MHEKQHQAFLDVLAENEDDVTTRLIYADWLDEQGYCEEAERQRLWPAAKKWMVDFVKRCEEEIRAEHWSFADSEEEYAELMGDNYDGPMSYQELIELGQRGYDNADRNAAGEIINLSVSCGNNESMSYLLRANREDFWKNWGIITGNPLPMDPDSTLGFRCAC